VTIAGLSVRGMSITRTRGGPAALTLVGVPLGLAVTGNPVGIAVLMMAAGLAVLTLVLHGRPKIMLTASLLSVAGLHLAGLLESGWAWPATAAFVAVVLAGHLRTATVAAATTLFCAYIYNLFIGLDYSTQSGFASVGGEVLCVTAVLAVAQAHRNTVRWQDEQAGRIAEDARRRRAEQRVDIARDLHDVVSHTLSVVGVHLNVALDGFDTDPDEARDSLRLAQQVRGRAMTDLRALVELLRDDRVAEPIAGLDGLQRLTDQVRDAGLDVTLAEFGDRSAVSAPVATAIYRVVQESLTNTVRHSGATRVTVIVRAEPAEVSVEITDDGRGGAPVSDGHGIAGMRERVAALGGALTAGSTSADGFIVRAQIPMTP
jgi:signal transduction histidine kinase